MIGDFHAFSPYSDFTIRRSIYSVFLFLAVLGPLATIVLTLANVRALFIEFISLIAALLGIPLLCVWCAIYVDREAGRVRVALIWIALLFFYLVGALLFGRHVVY